jgi:hypothetical protein
VKAKLVIGRFGTSPCSGPGTGHLRVQITSDCEKGLVRIKSDCQNQGQTRNKYRNLNFPQRDSQVFQLFIALSKMPQAIPLPPFSDQAIAIIGTPNAPSNPPSVMDITNAMHYARILLHASGMSGISLLCVL